MVFFLFLGNLYVLVRTSCILCTFFEHSCTIVHILTKKALQTTRKALFFYIYSYSFMISSRNFPMASEYPSGSARQASPCPAPLTDAKKD